MKNQIFRLHRLLSRSRTMTNIAQKVGNQASAVVVSHFTDLYPPAWTADPTVNGEYALVDVVGPTAANFVDVGANVGDWSTHFLERMKTPCGLVVDANSQCADTLRAKFSGIDGVTILQAALSDYCGQSTFYESYGRQSANSSLSPRSPFSGTANGRLVMVSTLDEEIKKLGWTSVSMVKIDAEGHDFFVLRGARALLAQRKIDFIQFECNSAWIGINIAAACSFLDEFGYQVFQLCAAGLRAVDAFKYGPSGIGGNWLAFHPGSPNLPLRRI